MDPSFPDSTTFHFKMRFNHKHGRFCLILVFFSCTILTKLSFMRSYSHVCLVKISKEVGDHDCSGRYVFFPAHKAGFCLSQSGDILHRRRCFQFICLSIYWLCFIYHHLYLAFLITLGYQGVCATTYGLATSHSICCISRRGWHRGWRLVKVWLE